MADFKWNSKGMGDLEKELQRKFAKVEDEANRAAAQQTTPHSKASAFARVLRKHGVDNVNETELRKKFGG